MDYFHTHSLMNWLHSNSLWSSKPRDDDEDLRDLSLCNLKLIGVKREKIPVEATRHGGGVGQWLKLQTTHKQTCSLGHFTMNESCQKIYARAQPEHIESHERVVESLGNTFFVFLFALINFSLSIFIFIRAQRERDRETERVQQNMAGAQAVNNNQLGIFSNMFSFNFLSFWAHCWSNSISNWSCCYQQIALRCLLGENYLSADCLG